MYIGKYILTLVVRIEAERYYFVGGWKSIKVRYLGDEKKIKIYYDKWSNTICVNIYISSDVSFKTSSNFFFFFKFDIQKISVLVKPDTYEWKPKKKA